MFRRRAPLIAFLLSVLLVFAQAAGMMHMIGHAGAATSEIAQPDHDSGHGAALSLSHVCTTCLAFSGLQAAPPRVHLPLPEGVAGVAVALPVYCPVATRCETPYRSRAPPVLA